MIYLRTIRLELQRGHARREQFELLENLMRGTLIMKKLTTIMPVLVVFAVALFLSGCTVRETQYGPGGTVSAEVDVEGPPPAPLADEVAISPGPDFLWIPGAWMWDGHWVWEKGRWDRRPHPGAVWVPHSYAYRNGRHVFVRGHWK
jgi:hypothetical protein